MPSCLLLLPPVFIPSFAPTIAATGQQRRRIYLLHLLKVRNCTDPSQPNLVSSRFSCSSILSLLPLPLYPHYPSPGQQRRIFSNKARNCTDPLECSEPHLLLPHTVSHLCPHYHHPSPGQQRRKFFNKARNCTNPTRAIENMFHLSSAPTIAAAGQQRRIFSNKARNCTDPLPAELPVSALHLLHSRPCLFPLPPPLASSPGQQRRIFFNKARNCTDPFPLNLSPRPEPCDICAHPCVCAVPVPLSSRTDCTPEDYERKYVKAGNHMAFF
ncbi:unnamed protein product [Closterium sp. NIES-64]|nr:unnamed protein product [Closterium sp. NIES-64]